MCTENQSIAYRLLEHSAHMSIKYKRPRSSGFCFLPPYRIYHVTILLVFHFILHFNFVFRRFFGSFCRLLTSPEVYWKRTHEFPSRLAYVSFRSSRYISRGWGDEVYIKHTSFHGTAEEEQNLRMKHWDIGTAFTTSYLFNCSICCSPVARSLKITSANRLWLATVCI